MKLSGKTFVAFSEIAAINPAVIHHSLLTRALPHSRGLSTLCLWSVRAARCDSAKLKSPYHSQTKEQQDTLSDKRDVLQSPRHFKSSFERLRKQALSLAENRILLYQM